MTDVRIKSTGPRLVEIVGLALLLLWPAFWSGVPLGFHDTRQYYTQGGNVLVTMANILGIERDVLSGPGEAAAPGTSLATGGPFVSNIRSVPYAVFVNVSVRAFGLFGPIFLTALATAALIAMFVHGSGLRRRLVAYGAVTLAANTSFYTSQIMPDILAAWLILIPMIVVKRQGIIGPVAGLALVAAATAAVLSHYAHIPLAAVMGVALAIWAIWRRRALLAIAAPLPLLVTLAFNLVLSVAIPGGSGASIAPARYPILLARALEDGVAVRYLSDTCEDDTFTICTIYDTFPDTVSEVLWSDNSLSMRATREEMRAISDEELPLLWQVFLYDPLAQTWALTGNSVEQLFLIGLGDMFETEYTIAGPATMEIELQDEKAPLFEVAENVQAVAVILALVLLVFNWPRLDRTDRSVLVVLALGLVANAAICGGLSVPTDRYQGRIVWLCVLAAAAYGVSDRTPRGATA